MHEAKAREDGKPDDVIAKIVDGQLTKWAKEVALLDQEHIRSDRYDGKTIEDLRAELAAKTGENIQIARLQVGEPREGSASPALPSGSGADGAAGMAAPTATPSLARTA